MKRSVPDEEPRMIIREQNPTEERDALIAEILQRYPPIQLLEEVMGPEPADSSTDDVDALMEARERQRQPYSPAEEAP
jgi:hypothetical protein